MSPTRAAAQAPVFIPQHLASFFVFPYSPFFPPLPLLLLLLLLLLSSSETTRVAAASARNPFRVCQPHCFGFALKTWLNLALICLPHNPADVSTSRSPICVLERRGVEKADGERWRKGGQPQKGVLAGSLGGIELLEGWMVVSSFFSPSPLFVC
ncbi:uncharacterized protein CIMG_13028 [Coccidioides immitis RS]|uniref:Uncharacterized protein n=1 Tax=Coccidioides immitis (strain RS) TaxID=246410 RepID=A0A0D8JW70_COCIM|nr:uncharacterized protein CIMG_13028 [Coccidioides immitis RS]KJF60533.1 hypothetical protein CIMG_13028 [Coccidioides immitis RS]